MGLTSCFFKMLMVLDGIGLAMIIGSTMLEGKEDWDRLFSSYFPENVMTVFFWISGIWLAVIGLVFVMFNAASFDTMHVMEHYGMAMLTSAPLINMCGWVLLRHPDPAAAYVQQLYTTEFLEFCGMALLDVTYFLDGLSACVVEVGAFGVLCLAALLDVTYTYPYLVDHTQSMFDISVNIVIRQHPVHWGEATGLCMLALVAMGKYIDEQCGCYAQLSHHGLIGHHGHHTAAGGGIKHEQYRQLKHNTPNGGGHLHGTLTYGGGNTHGTLHYDDMEECRPVEGAPSCPNRLSCGNTSNGATSTVTRKERRHVSLSHQLSPSATACGADDEEAVLERSYYNGKDYDQ